MVVDKSGNKHDKSGKFAGHIRTGSGQIEGLDASPAMDFKVFHEQYMKRNEELREELARVQEPILAEMERNKAEYTELAEQYIEEYPAPEEGFHMNRQASLDMYQMEKTSAGGRASDKLRADFYKHKVKGIYLAGSSPADLRDQYGPSVGSFRVLTYAKESHNNSTPEETAESIRKLAQANYTINREGRKEFNISTLGDLDGWTFTIDENGDEYVQKGYYMTRQKTRLEDAIREARDVADDLDY